MGKRGGRLAGFVGRRVGESGVFCAPKWPTGDKLREFSFWILRVPSGVRQVDDVAKVLASVVFIFMAGGAILRLKIPSPVLFHPPIRPNPHINPPVPQARLWTCARVWIASGQATATTASKGAR